MRATWMFLIAVCSFPTSGQHVHEQKRESLAERHASLVRLFYSDIREGDIARKCGTPMLVPITLQWEALSWASKLEVAPSITRPEKQTHRLSKSGRFRVHYDTTGASAPALLDAASVRVPRSHEAFVDSTIAYLDLIWTVLIDSMQYGRPQPDGSAGGGPEYDVYLEDLGFGFSGVTSWDPTQPIGSGPNKRFATYTELDNDFLDVRTKGMDGLKITAAHEFFHAIQIGSYGIWTNVRNSDFYFYELTAVWVEDALFTNVNDYYFDLPQYFHQFRDIQNRSFSFTTFNPIYPGYERSLWAHFLVKRFGPSILRRTWEAMAERTFLQAMTTVLADVRSGVDEEYATFTQWNYFTGFRADTVRFYPEGRYYPVMRPNGETRIDGFTGVSMLSAAYPLSSQTFLFTGTNDSLLAIVANVDMNRADSDRDATASLEVRVASSPMAIPYQKLSNGLNAGLAVSEPSRWRVVYLSAMGGRDTKHLAEVSPNPLRLSETTKLTLPLTTTCPEATVYFFSASFDLLYSATYGVTDYLGKRYVSLPTSDLRSTLPSGICFVVVECADTRQHWKIAIIR